MISRRYRASIRSAEALPQHMVAAADFSPYSFASHPFGCFALSKGRIHFFTSIILLGYCSEILSISLLPFPPIYFGGGSRFLSLGLCISFDPLNQTSLWSRAIVTQCRKSASKCSLCEQNSPLFASIRNKVVSQGNEFRLGQGIWSKTNCSL